MNPKHNYIQLLQFAFIVTVISFSSCKKPVEKQEPINIQTNKGVFIINEGTFGWGNSTISYYNLTTSEVITDIFKQANNRPLGDVCQSITYYDNKYYIVVNNSNKIEIVNSHDFKSISSIHNLKSPRYMLMINSTKAYISDIYDNKISVLNLSNNTVTKYISCIGSSEEMLLYQKNAFVTNTRTNYIYVINTETDIITDSIQVGTSPFSIKIDKNNKLWVLCSGTTNTNNNINGSLYKINPLNLQIEQHFDFSNYINVWNRLKTNKAMDTLYYIDNSVYQMNINSFNLPQTPIIPKGNCNFYGLEIEPDNGNIFVSDAIDYVQNGKIYIYNHINGNLIKSFNAGIIPSDFIFN